MSCGESLIMLGKMHRYLWNPVQLPYQMILYLLKTLFRPCLQADKHKCYMYDLIENFGRVQIEK